MSRWFRKRASRSAARTSGSATRLRLEPLEDRRLLSASGGVVGDALLDGAPAALTDYQLIASYPNLTVPVAPVGDDFSGVAYSETTDTLFIADNGVNAV